MHLTRSHLVRDVFHAMDGISTVLRCAVYFDGLPKFIYSAVQQMLEDPTYLSLSMSTAIRLCLPKLSKNPEKAITPLLYRDQKMALSILQESIEFQFGSGQIFVRYVEKGTAREASSSQQDSSSTAGSKRHRAAIAPPAAETSSTLALQTAPVDAPELPRNDTPRQKKQRVSVQIVHPACVSLLI